MLGAGSWGTTFAQVLWDAGTPAVLWARDAVIADSVNAVVYADSSHNLHELRLPFQSYNWAGANLPNAVMVMGVKSCSTS